MKRWTVFATVGVVLFSLTSVSFAGDRARGRWEGFAIGLGAVTLYNLFEHGQFSPVIPPHRGYQNHVHHPRVIHKPSGHWEVHREWIPEREERVWVPGHSEDGVWVKGHYEVVVYPGYYAERKVWVEYRSRGRHRPRSWAPAHGHRAR